MRPRATVGYGCYRPLYHLSVRQQELPALPFASPTRAKFHTRPRKPIKAYLSVRQHDCRRCLPYKGEIPYEGQGSQ